MQPMHWSTMHTASDTHASLYIQSADSNHTIAPWAGPPCILSGRRCSAFAVQNQYRTVTLESYLVPPHQFDASQCLLLCCLRARPSTPAAPLHVCSFMMPQPNFTQCGQSYMSNESLIARYNYSGLVVNIPANPHTQITSAGCTALCGSGNEYYPWVEISATITTWVLPILGTLLQAPFESNAFWRTVKAINRWIGSPISSLACILWDIEVSGKCALFGNDSYVNHVP
jgi:hypothetical protein